MTKFLKGFYAYPSTPSEVGDTIEAAVSEQNSKSENVIDTWRQLDIPGHFISQQVIEGIDESDFLVADISN